MDAQPSPEAQDQPYERLGPGRVRCLVCGKVLGTRGLGLRSHEGTPEHQMMLGQALLPLPPRRPGNVPNQEAP